MQKLIFLELNEINFEYLLHYIKKGLFPNWRNLFNSHGFVGTASESVYENMEPWIQWPTARTGLPFSDHGIFRLGDMGSCSADQHWELIERAGFSVAAVSPINAVNRTNSAPFWIPDPWVTSPVSGCSFTKRLYSAICQVVNDNAKGRVDLESKLALIEALIRVVPICSLVKYFGILKGVVLGQHWSKAILLDRLLVDYFVWAWRRSHPDFSVLFLNGGAHIQHHYMFNSDAYEGGIKNPIWYASALTDPVKEIYELYDDVIGDLLKLSNVRLLIGTGLKQVPYDRNTYYWRLKEHAQFLAKLGLRYSSVAPRMTRDFLVDCASAEDAIYSAEILRSIRTGSGQAIFEEVDLRENSIFVTLTFPFDIDKNEYLVLQNGCRLNFYENVAFVAVKNGHHDPFGYFVDTSSSNVGMGVDQIELKEIFNIVLRHFNLASFIK